LILGKEKFHLSIFKIDPGIDSGSIISTRSFDLSLSDDIKSSYYKAGLLTSQMLLECLLDIDHSLRSLQRQEGVPRYLPQRLPEDGGIDWTRTSREIYDFVRALTRPYPGAFSYLFEKKITIWKARPMSKQYFFNEERAGMVVKVFANEDFLVTTGDGLLLVEDYAAEESVKEGAMFKSCDFKKQMQTIINRHYAKYPNLILHDDILKAGRDR
jgi:methionyl-tRNA formyltransferase